MVDNVSEKICQLDTLICNAGISYAGLLSDIDEELRSRLFGINGDGVYHCCRAVFPCFVYRKAALA